MKHLFLALVLIVGLLAAAASGAVIWMGEDNGGWFLLLQSAASPYEDFTTYTEVDPNSHVEVTSTRVTHTDLEGNADVYVYADKGANHFDGNFEHLVTMTTSAIAVDDRCHIAMLANTVDDGYGIDLGGGSFLSARVHDGGGAWQRLYAMECDSGTLHSDYYNGFSPSTVYYLKIARDENVGDHGTYYIYVYSDDARTNLLDTLSVALNTSKKDFRYIYALNNENRTAAMDIDGYVENLDLQE